MDLQSTAQYRLGFIGGGKLASSVMRGILGAEFFKPRQIIASEPNEEARAALYKDLGISVTANNADVAEQSETILIGVKPGVVLPALQEIADRLDGKAVISLAAGVRIDAMEKTGPARFMRAMTNTPTAVCAGATAIARGSRSKDVDVGRARSLFGAIGAVVEVSEEQIDAVTALAGSGPAFVYSVIQALADGGTRCGLKHDDATILAIQTVLGAAELARESGKPLRELIDQVVTPGGTTAAGLAAMEKMRSLEGLAAAVEAATKRGAEMAKENR